MYVVLLLTFNLFLIFRITVSVIYLALWLLFTVCMSVLHCSVGFHKLNDDDDDDLAALSSIAIIIASAI